MEITIWFTLWNNCIFNIRSIIAGHAFIILWRWIHNRFISKFIAIPISVSKNQFREFEEQSVFLGKDILHIQILKFALYYKHVMNLNQSVILLDVWSEYEANVCSKTVNLICLKHLFTSTEHFKSGQKCTIFKVCLHAQAHSFPSNPSSERLWTQYFFQKIFMFYM